MKFGVAFGIVLTYLATVSKGFGTLCGSDGSKLTAFPPETVMPNNYKVAFLGDAGHGSQQKEVLQMVKNWGAQVVIHSGDFEYDDDPALFESQLNDVLGDSFPYFASIGNHDLDTWTGSNGHQARLIRRLEKFGGDEFCEGDYGVNMACSWNGLYFVLSGAGTRGSNHADYIDQALSASQSTWKFVSWHKNQRLMQIGGKSDETGWAVYDATRKHGAIVATGHEHSYCRSYIMSSFEDREVANFNETLHLREDETFVFVSGLGGKDIRSWEDDLIENEWWASYAADDNGVSDGALLCIFNIDGVLENANCTFRDRKDKVWDEFKIVSHLSEKSKTPKKETKKSCKQWIEVPIKTSDADFVQNLDTLTVDCNSNKINLVDRISTTLRFDDISLEKGAKVLQAYLQVYGAESYFEPTALRISVSKNTYSCKNDQVFSSDSFFKPESVSSVIWEKDDEDWEKHNVWVSPNLSKIINEAIQNDWESGNSLSLRISGKGVRSFYSFDYSPCLAPTLALEIETC